VDSVLIIWKGAAVFHRIGSVGPFAKSFKTSVILRNEEPLPSVAGNLNLIAAILKGYRCHPV